MLTVDIDANSGFCAGVIRAIGKAEEFLQAEACGDRKLYSLGAIVHNDAELNRLVSKGLVTIEREDLDNMSGSDGETLLIRAHGEPPQTYEKARSLGFGIIDCTCPVVLRLQKIIKETYMSQRGAGKGQIVIFGKPGHAEVLGLIGQTEGTAVVVEDLPMLEKAFADGLLKSGTPTHIFSQTTKSPSEYEELCLRLKDLTPDPVIHDTICRQVATRHQKLSEFALEHDVIVFVSGKASSNGKVLCDLCKTVNIRTYHVDSPSEIKREWFRADDKVGVCGATSTPKWLLEQAASEIAGLNNNNLK
ncbi:MAG: 4-hydroxy-3-methylbut-2-enyl diphosphate reductase [Candidatus Cryptobacteroides sp.]